MGGLIPPEMERLGELDLEELAYRFEMNGGHIRNVILEAAIHAARDGTGVSTQHLIAAGNAEYRSLGRLVREPAAD